MKKSIKIYSESELNGNTIRGLVEHYNLLTGSSIKKFQTKAIAVRRVLEAQENAMTEEVEEYNYEDIVKQNKSKAKKGKKGNRKGLSDKRASTMLSLASKEVFANAKEGTTPHLIREALSSDDGCITWTELTNVLISNLNRPRSQNPMDVTVANRRIAKMVKQGYLEERIAV